MRAKRSQKEFSDFVLNYSPRRKKTLMDEQTASDSNKEEEGNEGNESESLNPERGEEEKEEGDASEVCFSWIGNQGSKLSLKTQESNGLVATGNLGVRSEIWESPKFV